MQQKCAHFNLTSVQFQCIFECYVVSDLLSLWQDWEDNL